MISNEIFYKRAYIIQTVRNFFIRCGYLEVETPVRLPTVAPEMYIEPETAGDMFLQTSPELCMKRLLARGIPKLFQICKCYRRGEWGRLHLPEFTMLEWYRAGADYFDLMVECEELFGYLAFKLVGSQEITYAEKPISLINPWPRLKVAEAFEEYAPVSLEESLRQDIFDETLVNYIEPNLGIKRPVFLCDYPAELGALARLKGTEDKTAERFELYVGGVEIANGFSELTDPVQQRQRFVEEREKIISMGRNPGPMPEKFLHDLSKMPDSAGIALGIDRLVMLFSSVTSIGEVVCFAPEKL